MTSIGLFISAEEHGGRALVDQALNEHILGDRWPETDVRLEMLEEAVEVMRALWQGSEVSHRGRHYTVENARIYTRPDSRVEVIMSGFGPDLNGYLKFFNDEVRPRSSL